MSEGKKPEPELDPSDLAWQDGGEPAPGNVLLDEHGQPAVITVSGGLVMVMRSPKFRTPRN